MPHATPHASRRPTPSRAPHALSRKKLIEALEHVGHHLPDQGPISVFVHHNTLHAHQHLPFHQAVAEACAMHETQGYLTLDEYRRAIRTGRIAHADVEWALERYERWRPSLGGQAPGVSREQIERAIATHGLRAHTAASLEWALAEQGLHRRLREDLTKSVRDRLMARTAGWLSELLDGDSEAAFVAMSGATSPAEQARSLDQLIELPRRPEALRRAIGHQPEEISAVALWVEAQRLPLSSPAGLGAADLASRCGIDRTPRDLLLAMTGEDPAESVHPTLVRLFGAYLDQGMAHRAMPERDVGLFEAWRRLILGGPNVGAQWESRVRDVASLSAERGWDAAATLLHLLRELGVRARDLETFLTRVLGQLPGWAGMFSRLERHPEERGRVADVSLLEMCAVRLVYDIAIWRHFAERRLDFRGPLRELPAQCRALQASDARAPTRVREERLGAFRLFDLCQLLGITAPELAALDAHARSSMLAVADAFTPALQRRVLQEAYERHYCVQFLNGLAANRGRAENPDPVSAQMLFCIDDREESLRRHLEELDPSIQTLGVAGFFGVAIKYRGLDDAAHSDLCPVVVKPSLVIEEAHDDDVSATDARSARRSFWARAQSAFGRGSRSLAAGTLLTPTLGVFASVPFVTRLLFPRASSRVSRSVSERLIPRPKTRLVGAAAASQALPPIEDQARMVRGTLENVGLVRGFAPLVLIAGHGAFSVNNPHMSAYSCGACGGQGGGPNARLFARMANDADVRALLRTDGIDIPEATYFVGCEHDTTRDAVEFFDLALVPASHSEALAALRGTLSAALERNAHERCRRFEHAPLSLSPQAALRHVEARAQDLGQPRPELGHVTIAACIVGRRALSRGLFLDRRAFLVEYDPGIDPSGAILERILAAVGPVGAGINLEYYFSRVDNERFGAGTKLPHNPTAMVGVMEGSEGDLRTGLPSQMIEIHEPMRLLLVCEATPETLAEICQRRPEVAELVVGDWVRVVSVDPRTGAMHTFEAGEAIPYEGLEMPLPEVPVSADWYRGKRDFLGPALITSPHAAPRSARS